MKTFIVLAVFLVSAFAYKSPEKRIINGQLATPLDFPYQAGIETDTPDGPFRCGGAIIAPKVILSAAHCFRRARTGRIHAGSNRWMGGVVRPYNKVVVHEEYVSPLFMVKNDIALVFLDKPLPIDGKTIATIPLESTLVAAGEEVVASGFGKIEDFLITDDLSFARLKIRDNSECSGRVTAAMICAGGEQMESTCGGDSGGPIVVGWPNNPRHVGLASFGPKSCEEGNPRVFTRTSSHVEWILKHKNDY